MTQTALPRAPPSQQQAVSAATIWHTTLGRILQPPLAPRHGRVPRWRSGALDLRGAAQRMTAALCGMSVRIAALWFVAEHDLLALALHGAFTADQLPLEGRNC